MVVYDRDPKVGEAAPRFFGAWIGGCVEEASRRISLTRPKLIVQYRGYPKKGQSLIRAHTQI